MVKVTDSPGARTSATAVGKSGPDAGVAVVAGLVVVVVQVPGSICGGTGSSKVALAVVNSLVLVTTTV